LVLLLGTPNQPLETSPPAQDANYLMKVVQASVASTSKAFTPFFHTALPQNRRPSVMGATLLTTTVM
jgi:hypothetical protein